MNIFYFNENPKQCAVEHCDKHVVKMIVEYAQLLSTTHRVLDGTPIATKQNNRWKTVYQLEDSNFDDILYKATHINHPSAKWVRNSYSNYSYLLNLWIQLLEEYCVRYKKVHKSSQLTTYLINSPVNIKYESAFEPPWRAMPDEYKISKDVDNYCEKSYQAYFNGEKQHLANWKTYEPGWFVRK